MGIPSFVLEGESQVNTMYLCTTAPAEPAEVRSQWGPHQLRLRAGCDALRLGLQRQGLSARPGPCPPCQTLSGLHLQEPGAQSLSRASSLDSVASWGKPEHLHQHAQAPVPRTRGIVVAGSPGRRLQGGALPALRRTRPHLHAAVHTCGRTRCTHVAVDCVSACGTQGATFRHLPAQRMLVGCPRCTHVAKGCVLLRHARGDLPAHAEQLPVSSQRQQSRAEMCLLLRGRALP